MSDIICVVTGSSGFIGSHLVKRLATEGFTEPKSQIKAKNAIPASRLKLKLLVRETSDLSPLAHIFSKHSDRIEVIRGSMDSDDSLLISACQGAQYIFHCAAKVNDWGTDEEFRKGNIDLTTRMLKAAEATRSSLKRFLYISTVDAYGYPVAPMEQDETLRLKDVHLSYNSTKVKAEQNVWEAYKRGLPVSIIRPTNVWGPRGYDFVVEMVDMIAKKEMAYIGGGKTDAGLVYVENLVDLILLATLSEKSIGEAYNAWDGEYITWRRYLGDLADGCGLQRPWIPIPFIVAFYLAWLLEFIWGLLLIKTRPLITRHACYLTGLDQGFPIEKAQEHLGWMPRVSYEEGMEKTLDWLHSPDCKFIKLPHRPPTASSSSSSSASTRRATTSRTKKSGMKKKAM